jgi:carboxylate-amine ligase
MTPTARELHATFEDVAPLTVGIEDELMLLDPDTLDLAAAAPDALAAVGDDARFKLELPASQIEIVTPPHRDVPAAVRDLAAGRRRVLALPPTLLRPALRAYAALTGPAALLTWDEAARAAAGMTTPRGTAGANALGVSPRSPADVLLPRR